MKCDMCKGGGWLDDKDYKCPACSGTGKRIRWWAWIAAGFCPLLLYKTIIEPWLITNAPGHWLLMCIFNCGNH